MSSRRLETLPGRPDAAHDGAVRDLIVNDDDDDCNDND